MKNGIDSLIASGFEPLRGLRVGLVSHVAARCGDLRGTFEVFANSSAFTLSAVFGPEHGFHGEAQDLIAVPGAEDRAVPLHTLYGDTFKSLKPTRRMLDGLDVLVIDLVDIGSRYYTFQATMLYCLEACAEAGLPVMVLDRPNPIGRTVEGPALRNGFESFVGVHDIATRHGLTIGELAKLYQRDRVPDATLTVIPCEGEATEFVVPPSPNMPTLRTALVYPGGCLIEGTNLSEGRGTTRPFEYVGFPGADPQRLAERLAQFELNDVAFLPITFRPTFQKHAGQSCGGVFVVPTGPRFQPVRMGLALLMAFREHLGERFRWRTEVYEFVDHIPAIDLLFGSSRERFAMEAGAGFDEIARAWIDEENKFSRDAEALRSGAR